MLIFSLDRHEHAMGQALAAELDTAVAPHEDRSFEDGECKLRPLVNPRGADAYVLLGLHGGPVESPHDKLVRQLMFIATLRDHGARRVTAVVPYLAYARKDRRTKPHDPVGQRCVAQLFEAMGAAQIFALEVHNPAAFENAFRIPTIHLDARAAFDAVVHPLAETGPVVVASPDPGGAKRAQLWREELESRLRRPVGFAMVDKRRSSGVVSSMHLVSGEVEGATVLLFDDIVATGTTMQRAAEAIRREGAARVYAFAAHGLFVPPAAQALGGDAIEQLVVTDSVPAFRLPPDSPLRKRLQIVSCVPLLAAAIRESHASWVH